MPHWSHPRLAVSQVAYRTINQRTLTGCHDSRAVAYEELTKAVRVLTADPTAYPLSKVPKSLILLWDKENLAEMELHDVYRLGKSWLEGIEGELDPNPARACEVWGIAAQRGSVEAQYSVAVCLRHGNGVLQDVHKAFKSLENIAKTHNYGLAHVRLTSWYTLNMVFANGIAVLHHF
jgi:TPR repeat protein